MTIVKYVPFILLNCLLRFNYVTFFIKIRDVVMFQIKCLAFVIK